MFQRIMQFFRGLTAFNYDDTLAFKYLNSEELELFLRLPTHEKKHAVGTACSIQALNKEGKDMDVLIKAALLHDIGKVKSGAGVIEKSILVLMDKLMPSLSWKISRKMNMFYVYYNHPDIGAELLESINTKESVILLVRYHHSHKKADILGMGLLKKADDLN